MVDAYKCQHCGELVDRPRNCPVCGETAMRPTRVPESELHGEEDDEATGGTDDGEATADGAAPADDHTGTSEETATDGRHSERQAQRERTGDSGGGLLAWLKSLF